MENKVENHGGLARSLGLVSAIAIVVGTCIGSGVFFKPAKVFLNAGSYKMGIAAWIFAGIITLFAALTTAEIASAIPQTGGMFAYIKELYGENIAFMLGWAQTLIYTPATVAAMSVMIAGMISKLLVQFGGSEVSSMGLKLIAIAMIIIMVIHNSFSVKIGGAIQVGATFLKLIPLVLMIVTGLFIGKLNPASAEIPASVFSASKGFGAALIACMWAYDGWNTVANMGGEMKNPKKDLPRAIIFGLGIVMAVYVLVNMAIAKAIPVDEIITKGDTAVIDAARAVIGDSGSLIISIGILISLYGSMNGYFLSGVRVPYAMAVDNLLPGSKILAKTNASKSPIAANILALVIAIFLVIIGSFNMLTDLVVFVLWIFFILMVAGVFLVRKRSDLVSSYKVPLYPVVPVLGILGGLYILISSFQSDWKLALVGVVVTVLGLPVYYLHKQGKI